MLPGRSPGPAVAPCKLAAPDPCRPQDLSTGTGAGSGLSRWTDCGLAALVPVHWQSPVRPVLCARAALRRLPAVGNMPG
jgi:hypothetical protein